MDIHKELARIFAGAVPKLTDTQTKFVIQHEKTHDEYMAYREDELRLIIASLEAARAAVQEVYKALNRHNIPIEQMLICAEDCLTESIDETYRKLSNS